MRLLLIALLGWNSCAAALAADTDVLVYAATGAGVTAAIAAARDGVKVVLVEPGQHVGGMVSGGLSHTDFGDLTAMGGLALEFHERVAKHYGTRPFYWRGPEPRVAEKILRDWLNEAGVTLRFGRRVESVRKQDGVIAAASFNDGSSVRAKVFVDASYEGDLFARAGVSFSVGREGRNLYGESLAGRKQVLPDMHQFKVPVSPFVNRRDGEVLPLVHTKPPVFFGEGDGGVMGYGYRFVMTKVATNRIPFAQPENYDPAQFELFRRFFAAKGHERSFRLCMSTIVNLPNEKAEVNSIGPLSTMLLDGSTWKYPEADYATRDAIARRHLDYQRGLMWFLANDPAVPGDVRDEFQQWGLCRDEFADTGHWPHQLYVREGRRMQGEFILTQRDLTEAAHVTKPDAICYGTYHIDIREVQRIWEYIARYPDYRAEVFNEGYQSVPTLRYQIPYRALLPRTNECRNLLVPVGLSASHVAFASVRMEPTWMMVGHAAGTASALAVKKHGGAVHSVSVPELQEKLEGQRAILSLAKNPAGNFASDEQITLHSEMPALVEFEGDGSGWSRGYSAPNRFAYEYFENKTGRGGIRFTAPIAEAAEYEVAAWWPHGENRATNTTAIVEHADGEARATLDQSKSGGAWVPLGPYRFEPGKPARVRLLCDGASGTVAADTVRWKRVP